MFNNYIWETYLKAGGKDVVEMFERNLTEEFSKDYSKQISKLHNSYCPDVEYDEYLLDELYASIKDGDFFTGCLGLIELPEKDYTSAEILNIFSEFLKKEAGALDKDVFEEFIDKMSYYTTFFSIIIPELFIPYYFQYNFNILEKIAQEFEIELSQIPNKKDYKERFFYYGEICDALIEFRDEHNMSPFELCAFVYDFAPKYIGGIDSYIVKDLPEPKSAFFIGGDAIDEDLSKVENTVSLWQCSPNAKAGDIAVMYLRTPISSVDSVWRCASDGFIDPFFYYYRCAYITQPTPIKRVSQKKLEKDKVFKNLPIVRKNMQGINGVELLPSQYNYLMDLTKSTAMRLEYTVTESGIELLNEKDVENKLIKPLITKLGYKETDFEQQLRLEIGNHNNMIIPDFVILPDKTRGKQTAHIII